MRRLVLVIAAGCGRIAFDARDAPGGDGGPEGDAAPACTSFGPWGTPRAVAELNSTVNEYGAHITADGLTLYFDSNRPGASAEDIYVAHRPDRASPFAPPVRISELSTAVDEGDAVTTDDQLEIWFGRNSCIMHATRPDTGSTWGTPVDDPPCTEMIHGAFVTSDRLTLYYNNTISGAEGVLERTTRMSRTDPFPAGAAIPELDDGFAKGFASLSTDGLTIYFEKPVNSQLDLLVATRPDLASPFDAPQPITELDTPITNEEDPAISADGLELFFTSDRPGGTGLSDLYVTTRTCQ